MPWFWSTPRKPVGRRVGGREWSWTWEPERPPRPRGLSWLLGMVVLVGVALAVGLTLGFTLSDDGEQESPAATSVSGEETPPATKVGEWNETPSHVSQTEAVFVSLWDGSAPEGDGFANRCDAYITTAHTEMAHPLPDGDYVFQVTDMSGNMVLSTDEVGRRQVRIVGGVLQGVSGEGRHGMGGDSLGGATTVQICPFDESPDASEMYQLWLTSVESFQGDLEAVDSAAGDFHGFLVDRSLLLVFRVTPGR